jgi:2-keto-4-pentenoate hydratase/2-oxohepta-3-ene-1,7-dioic acid hydratase in catechol pathway
VRVANVAGRAHVVIGDEAFDIEQVSAGRFGAEPQDLFARWNDLREWHAGTAWSSLSPARQFGVDDANIGPPAPAPRQVFGVGLNYRRHATEANLPIPKAPVIFTKFPSCLTGAYSEIRLPTENVDWEVEVVVIVGRDAVDVPEARAWEYVAGVSVGQDISERIVQGRPPVAQFSMGKSFATFGPFGPTIVTIDELENPDDLDLSCRINRDEVQRTSTTDLIFTIPELIAYLSSIVTIYAGDVIFTGTPSGVGGARDPEWYLKPGDVIESQINGVGLMRNRCTGMSPNSRVGA